jgi:tetratricopeptide (TPR) repeat protein
MKSKLLFPYKLKKNAHQVANSREIEVTLEKLVQQPSAIAIATVKRKWNSNLATVLEELGNKYLRSNKFLDAANSYKEVLELKSFSLNLLTNLTISLYRIGEYQEAVIFAKKAYDLHPKDLIVIKIYIDCLLLNGNANEIDTICKDLCLRFPDDLDLKYFHAQALRLLGLWDASLKILDALVLNKNHPLFSFSRADVIGETDSIKAIEIYENLERKKIKFTSLNFYNLSLHYLRKRDFEKGWPLFEYGLDKDIGHYGRRLPYNFLNTFRADKESVDTEKWVMICSEQGIGDQLTFLSVLPETINEFKKVFFVCEYRMLPILQRSFPSLNLSTNGKFGDLDPSNESYKAKLGYIPLGSLLARYRPNLDSFKGQQKNFISVDKNMYYQYREFLLKLASGRQIIGISWKSNVAQNLQSMKNLDFLDWLPLFDNNSLIVNLQYGDTSAEQQFVNNLGLEMISFNNLNFTQNLDEWLAITAACDSITSISTSLVHFAGACGQKVAVVMPLKQGHWTLGLTDTESIFYPNVRIFRKQKDETDSSLIIRAAASNNAR